MRAVGQLLYLGITYLLTTVYRTCPISREARTIFPRGNGEELIPSQASQSVKSVSQSIISGPLQAAVTMAKQRRRLVSSHLTSPLIVCASLVNEDSTTYKQRSHHAYIHVYVRSSEPPARQGHRISSFLPTITEYPPTSFSARAGGPVHKY